MPLSKSENQTTVSFQNGLKIWLGATRPKTWIAGISPVLIGTVLSDFTSWSLFMAALAFSLLIQIGTNYSNDYYDSIKGADANRVGPVRFVASGQIKPETMRNASLGLFGAAFCVSLPLVAVSGLWALCFVFSSIAFGILYTGGPKPLGYLGLGELCVLPYFGPIAVLGSYFVQSHMIPSDVFWLSLSPGLLSCAILIANNLRDRETDRVAGKNTLVVRFGRKFGVWEYGICVIGALLLPMCVHAYAQLIFIPLAVKLITRAARFQKPKEAAVLLPQTALLLILFTTLFCIEIHIR